MLSVLPDLPGLGRPILLIAAAVAGLLLAPRLKVHRVTGAAAGALAVVLLDEVLFITLGGSPWRWLLLVPPAALWLAPWVIVPYGLYRSPPPQQPPAMEPFDPARHPVPELRQAWMAPAQAELEQAGFVRIDDVAIGTAPRPVQRLIVMDHAEGTRASLQAGTTALVSFSTVLADGRWVAVSNRPEPNPIPPTPELVGAALPDVLDPRELLAVFRALVRDAGGGQPRSLPPGTDARSMFAANLPRVTAQLLAMGWYRRTADGGVAMSPRAALYAAWVGIFPLRQILTRVIRGRQDRLMRRLGFPRPRRLNLIHPLRWWLAGGGLQAMGAAALLALGVAWPRLAEGGGPGSLLPIPLLARSDTVIPARLPDGFSVPADFAGAVVALERLAGARAEPLMADDGLSGARVRDAVSVPAGKRRADALVAAAQPLFLARGFVIFRTQAFSGVHGESEAVALFPSRDPVDAVLKMNTNGDNYGIGTPRVAAWLREVRRDHPLTVVAAEFDDVEARFQRPLTADEASALAGRVARFCPDVVSQGTGSVEALAREMRRTRTLYCWWD